MLALLIATALALAGEPAVPSTDEATRTLSHFAAGEVPATPTVLRAITALRASGAAPDLPLLIALSRDESGRVRLHAREAVIAIRRRSGALAMAQEGSAMASNP